MVILITGVSSGFGLATARRLASDGHTVYGTVRRDVDRLDGVHYLKADVRDDDSVRSAVRELITSEGRIDVLINNAGMGIGGPAEFNSMEDIELQMDTNFLGQVRFTKAVLQYMRRQKSGRIICFSSIGGLMGLPFQSYYSASKFAIEGFCEALRMEVGSHGIKVIVIEPGDFATGFTASRRKGAVNDEAASAYPALYSSVASFENDERTGMKPEHLADRLSHIVTCSHPRYSYVISTFEQKLSIFLKAILPKPLFASILKSYYKL